MRIRELRKPKPDSDLSPEAISDKIGAHFRETKPRGREARRIEVRKPVGGVAAESYSRIVADSYRRRSNQVGGEKAGIAKGADGKPRESKIQHDSSPIHAGPGPISGNDSEPRNMIDPFRKEPQTASENRKKCLTTKDIEDIRKMYFDEGLSLTRIATQMGVGRTTLSRAFEREGWSVRPQPHGPKPRPEDYDRIRRLYFEDGLTQGEVAKELGVSQRQVQRVFEAEEWTPRRRGGRLESRSKLGPPIEESSAEGHSRAVAHGYKRRRLQAGGEEARKTGSPDEEPRERRVHPHGPMPKTEDYDRIRRLYFEEGLSLDKVATELGVSRGQILKVFETQGWTLRPRLGQPALAPEDHEKIRKLYFDEKLSLSQVARQLGVSATTVGEVLKREGWSAQPQRGRTKWDSETVRKRYFDEAAVQKDAEARHSRVQPQKKRVDRDEVYRLHFEEGLTHQAIAVRL